MSKRIYLASPHMSDEGYELDFIKDAFEKNWIAPAGENIINFEEDVKSYTKSPYAVALNSGAASLQTALRLAGVKQDDIVLCQSNTYVATANAILYEKAIPVFVDSDWDTWNISPEYLEEALKKYPNAKAIMIVHIYGMTPKMDEILEIAKRYNVPVIEDAAESLGTFYKGKHTGTLGNYGVLSFNGNKIITTSSGGMLLTKNKEDAERALKWSAQAKDEANHFEHSELGYTYRLSNVLAGIGRGQMKVLDKRVEKKKYIFEYYKNALKDIKDITFMPTEHDFLECNYWLSAFLIDKNSKVKNIDIFNELNKNNVESRIAWKPMHLQPLFKDSDFIGSNVSEDIFDRGLCLPSDTKLIDEDLNRIVSIIKNLWKK